MHVLFYTTIFLIKIFGTLVYRGTPVDNHFLNLLMLVLANDETSSPTENARNLFSDSP
jgi:cytochrome b561